MATVRAAAAPALMLCVLGVAFRRLIAGRVLAGGDLHLYFYPYWVEVARSLQAGRLPMWNPYLFAGAPLLANSQVGVFYPLNWPFWLLFPAAPAPITKAIHWSVLLHVALAALNLFITLRRRKLGAWSAALGGVVYAGSGFVGVHTEHLNQLQALAWLPLLFMPRWEWLGPGVLRGITGVRTRPSEPVGTGRLGARTRPRLDLPHPASIAALAMILLAGHTQMAFIAVVGLCVWTLARWLSTGLQRSAEAVALWGRSLAVRFLGLTPYVVAVAISAVQLAPTMELVRYSGRSGGLDWREAVSFSLAPWQIPQALLPAYLVSPLLPEGVATVGILALIAAALGICRVVTGRNREGWPWLALSLAGIAGALGGYNPLYLLAVRLGIPGFVHFRAPARFLVLFVLGSAALAASADEWLVDLAHRSLVGIRRGILAALAVMIPLAVAVDVCLSAERLPHAAATISRAYTDLRPATADLAAHAAIHDARSLEVTGGQDAAGRMPGRFLSMSQALFEVGDKPEIETAYGASLSRDALWAYLVSSKYREIMAPNLSMLYQVQAVDGYDGGLLPLSHFIDFSQLLLPGGTVDGRLRENITAIPDQRWLDLLGVAHLVTDKTTDAWIEGVLYDRQFQPLLEGDDALAVAWLPRSFAADSLTLLYEGSGALRIGLADGRDIDFELPSSQSLDVSRAVAWDGPAPVTKVLLRGAGNQLRLGAASLVHSRSGTFYPIVLSDAYRLVHSGDVKIYERVVPGGGVHMSEHLGVSLVHQACSVDPKGALALMRDPAFDPSRNVLLIEEGVRTRQRCTAEAPPPGSDSANDTDEWVRLTRVREDRVIIDVQASSEGYVVLSDSWYPGWKATVQRLDYPAEAADIDVLQADLLFRAVPIAAGQYRVTLSYAAHSLAVGTSIGVIGTIGLWLYVVLWVRRRKA